MVRRVVIDTNVVISALRSRRGPSFRLLSLVGTGRFEITLSVPLALEYDDAASRATSVPAAALSKILGFLCSTAHRQKIFFLWRPYLPDPKDEMVLELAVAAQASHIVTYNQKDFRGAERFGSRAEFEAALAHVPDTEPDLWDVWTQARDGRSDR